MKKSAVPAGIFLSLLLCLGARVHGQNAVSVGSPAPPLSIDEWIKGESFSRFDPGTVYLLEFWGTWCGPCVENIPRLSEIQRRFADQGLIVLGVASHEFKGREALAAFMKARGGTMAYRVAFDADQSMERDWDTGGLEGVTFRLPLSFVIDRNGRIAFVGHPEDMGMEHAIITALASK
jgi:thiol-disulfide isomerase/thioredoxin